jgi:hypothetical protein
MEFRTIVDIPKPNFQIAPCERMLFVGSCFADRMGKRFTDEKFRTVVNPFGVMYNPVSIRHTIERLFAEDEKPVFDTAILTLGTNHVYVEKSTGEVVDNCQKRPANLFDERELTVEECANELYRSCQLLMNANSQIHIVLTVSPIRYAKYGYHGSQLSKATLLLAIDKLINAQTGLMASPLSGRLERASYFPAYEIVNDELRDYRFYAADMLHPSDQAVAYIYERFAKAYFSEETFQFLKEWKPIADVLNHKPFHPESDEYRVLMDKTMLKVAALSKKYPNFAL